MLDITEKLLDSLNETARTARNNLLFFLVVALYLLLIVSTTTDLMLLRGEIAALPQIEVGVPVVAFYIVAPLIFLLLHSNLLLRLSQLAETIKQWEVNSGGLKDEYSSLVFPLDFARLLLDGKPRWALYALVVTQIAILPIVVLLALQMSFLAYQSSVITFWHQLIVTFDLVLLFSFVCFVIGTREKRKVERNYVLKMLFQMRGTVFSAGLILILTWTIAVVPDSWQETVGIIVAMLVGLFFLLRPYVSKYLRNKQDNESNEFFLPAKRILLYGFILLSFLGIVAVVVDDLQERSIQQQLSAWVFADWWKGYPTTSYRPVRRFLNVAEQLIVLKEVPPEIVGESIIEETKFKDEEAKSDPLCKYIGELDLSGRQLNYALFYGSQFRCVKLESAELQDADLSKAKLHGANLFKAKLHSANLFRAELYDADLQWTELHGADLREAKLHDADLRLAELHGANLRLAELHGADLQWTELHGADLSEAELHGANLYEAELHGADLWLAELYGADLQWTELYGVNLSETELHGANLGDVILKNTNLSDVSWDKPKYWLNIISNIRVGLKKRGLADDEINEKVSKIKGISSRISSTEFGFVQPTTPIATDCVFHSGQGPFKEWPTPAERCDIKLASSLTDFACWNQWTAKGIVERAILRKEDIDLVKALLNEDCSFLDPYREALNNRRIELNQLLISE